MTVNQRVAGSSPAGGATKMIKPLYCYSVAVFDLYICNVLHNKLKNEKIVNY